MKVLELRSRLPATEPDLSPHSTQSGVPAIGIHGSKAAPQRGLSGRVRWKAGMQPQQSATLDLLETILRHAPVITVHSTPRFILKMCVRERS